MSLLRDIQEGATGDSVSPSVLLRQVKLLASRIAVPEIAEWAERELSGYEEAKDLPPYRGPFPARVLADLSGPFGSGFKNYALPPMAFPERFRSGDLFTVTFFQGVAQLESLAAAGTDLREPWTADAVTGIRVLMEGGDAMVDPHLQFLSVWKAITRAMLVGVLDAVRNRLLDFTLRLADEVPAAEAEQRSEDPNRVAQIFHTTIYSGAANVAVGNRDVHQTIQLPEPGDESGLLHYLKDVGVSQDAVDELRIALAADAREEHGAGPGRRALTWLKTVSAASAGAVGSGVAVNLITQALLHHFGM
jgi:hypothetical protein